MAKLKNLYKGTQPFFRYIFKDGSEAAFVGGRYLTDNPEEIKQLDAEVASAHPFIYVDPSEPTVDVEFADELRKVQEEAVAKFLAEKKQASDPNNDMGETGIAAQLKGIATSKTIAEAASGSTSGAQVVAAPTTPAPQAK